MSRRKGNYAKFQDMLPITTPTGGLLTGFVPCDWWINNAPIYPYKACCQDVRTWQVQDAAVRLLRESDPYWRLGYRHYAPHVVCGICGTEVNAGEYRP